MNDGDVLTPPAGIVTVAVPLTVMSAVDEITPFRKLNGFHNHGSCDAVIEYLNGSAVPFNVIVPNSLYDLS